MSPAQARSAESVDDLVAAARQRFGQFGYKGTSIDDIARVAGRTKGAVYHHFPDKRALFEHAFAAEQQALATEVARSTTLAGGIATYLRTVASTPAAARITLLDGPAVLGWTRWRSCDDGPFRTMLRRSLDAESGAGDSVTTSICSPTSCSARSPRQRSRSWPPTTRCRRPAATNASCEHSSTTSSAECVPAPDARQRLARAVSSDGGR